MIDTSPAPREEVARRLGIRLPPGRIFVTHQWNEVYLVGAGWVPVDVLSPGSALGQVAPQRLRICPYGLGEEDSPPYSLLALTNFGQMAGKYVIPSYQSRDNVADRAGDPKTPPADLFPVQSVWTTESGLTLTVLERRGETFRAKLVVGDWIERLISGTVKGNAVSWRAKDVQAVKGGVGHDNSGTIRGDQIDMEYKTEAGIGRFTLHRGAPQRH